MKNALEKKSGVLYCVCNRAGTVECDRCPKGREIKPDHTLNFPGWRRVLGEFVK